MIDGGSFQFESDSIIAQNQLIIPKYKLPKAELQLECQVYFSGESEKSLTHFTIISQSTEVRFKIVIVFSKL
jgi:hypothetical protein